MRLGSIPYQFSRSNKNSLRHELLLTTAIKSPMWEAESTFRKTEQSKRDVWNAGEHIKDTIAPNICLGVAVLGGLGPR